MNSRAVTVGTVLSMLLCAAIVQLWCAPDVRVVFLVDGEQWEAYSRGGAIGLTNAPQIDVEAAQRQAAMLPHLRWLIAMAGSDKPSYESDRRRERAILRLLLESPRIPLERYSVLYALLADCVVALPRAAHIQRRGRSRSQAAPSGSALRVEWAFANCPYVQRTLAATCGACCRSTDCLTRASSTRPEPHRRES